MKSKGRHSKTGRSIRFWIILAVIWAVIILLNVLAWNMQGFSTWYADHFMIIWVNTYSRLTNLVPFSAGEIMLTAAVILAAVLAVLLILLIFLHRKRAFRRGVFRYFKALLSIGTIICLLMTLNCTMLYHADPIDPNPQKASRRYTVDELQALRDHIIEECNELSLQMERDSEGYVVYAGDMQQTAREAMRGISDIYPRLDGYYPNVKHMIYSRLMCQMYMAGYYFPFSMESNCNGMMYTVNYPQTYCHELSHLHGYIYEDEANFISFLACIKSDDPFFRYSGYLSVLNYVYNSYWNYIEDWDEYANLPQTNELVDKDNIFLTDETWLHVEETAVLDTETVDEISDTFTDTTLKANGVSDGMASYSRVVGLLLEYYEGILY